MAGTNPRKGRNQHQVSILVIVGVGLILAVSQLKGVKKDIRTNSSSLFVQSELSVKRELTNDIPLD